MMKKLFLIYVSISVNLVFFSCNTGHSEKDDHFYDYKRLPLDKSVEEKYVFLIGLDGWGGYSFNSVMFDMPSIEAIVPESSYTFEALDIMPSITIPNWASMFMGSGPDIHGYQTNPPTNNDAPTATPTYIDKYGFFPSIFTLLKEERPNCKVAFFFEKPKIGYLCPDNVIDKKHNIINLSSSESGILSVTSYIETEKPNLTVIVFLEPDGIGHLIGHDTQEYYDQLKIMDNYIAKIIESIKNAGIWDDSILFFSSDHGGIGKGHGNNTPLEREIPLIVMGENIRSNYNIEGPVMIYDIATTIAQIFKLDVPDFWSGRILNIFCE
jgi:predicted AlkP superfamily pyrophosphatase or phosphodiesterase